MLNHDLYLLSDGLFVALGDFGLHDQREAFFEIRCDACVKSSTPLVTLVEMGLLLYDRQS